MYDYEAQITVPAVPLGKKYATTHQKASHDDQSSTVISRSPPTQHVRANTSDQGQSTPLPRPLMSRPCDLPSVAWGGLLALTSARDQYKKESTTSGSASVGCRRQCIVVEGALVVPSNSQAVGGSVGGITPVELWWGRCRGGGISYVGALAASNTTTNH